MKYKHIPTGIIVEGATGDSHFNGPQWSIPALVVQRGKDWEEVKEKEWEITGFGKKCLQYYRNPDGTFTMNGSTSFCSMNYLLSHYPIYSVKRLSDGVEFKIGDKVKGYGRIEAFNVIDGGGFIHVQVSADEWVTLRELQKAEKLFTTEDGVDIYEGDEYWFVRRRTKNSWGNWESDEDYELFDQKCAMKAHVEQDKAYPGKYINFSTKEAAEEYILMNKPCLSVNDILNHTDWKASDFPAYLKQYAKSKS